MSEFGSFLTKKLTEKIENKPQSIDIVKTVNETIEALLSVRNSPPGMEVIIPEKRVLEICNVARIIFLKQPILLELSAPIQICGDTHGQFSDLLRIFEMGGFPPRSNYLFLGDYVDRAKQGTETMLLLLCYKIKFARSFFLLRGNHECAFLNKIYGFYDECKRRYSVKVWKAFVDCFNCMPVAAVIENQIFCAHGGLSPEMKTLADVFKLERPTEIKDAGLLCDLLWSDPASEYEDSGWSKSPRGVSYQFGPDIIDEFLEKNKLSLIVRAHQVVEDGYEFYLDRKLVTIFSAPNYCGEFDNAGAILVVNASMVCSFRIVRPETHKLKFPELFPDQIVKDYSGQTSSSLKSDDVADDEMLDIEAGSIRGSITSQESSSSHSTTTDAEYVVPKDYESLNKLAPNLNLSYEDYIKLVDAKNNKKYF